MTKYVAGIDFGTTNSSAAIGAGGDARMVMVEGTHDTIPTALYFPEKSGTVYFGRAARDRYVRGDGDGRFMRSLKRILGTDSMRGGTLINGHVLSFDDIIGRFIVHLKNQIDNAAAAPVDSVVMGRPVHFRDDDADGDARAQAELEHIARAAGFKNIAFQYEPIAAAFAHEQKLTREMLAIVIDMGGGTSDFTVIRLSPQRRAASDRTSDILANTGVRIGGNDFDKDLALRAFMPMFGMGSQYRSGGKLLNIPAAPYISLSTWSAVNEVYNYKTMNMVRGWAAWGTDAPRVTRLQQIIQQHLGHTNLDYVEQAKISLSDNDDVHMVLDFLDDAPSLCVTRPEFQNAINGNVARVAQCIDECVAAAGVRHSDINLVIMTGGSTEIPYVNSVVQNRFPTAAISADDKMASVGLGLAYDAMRRFRI